MWWGNQVKSRWDEQLNSHELFAQLAVADIPLQVWIGFPQSPHSFILSTSICTSIVSLLVHTQQDYKLLEEDLELLCNPYKQSVKSCFLSFPVSRPLFVLGENRQTFLSDRCLAVQFLFSFSRAQRALKEDPLFCS